MQSRTLGASARLLLPLIAAVSSLAWPMHARAAPRSEAAVTVVENVTVLPMTADGAISENARVVIENGRITSLQGPVPLGARRINGKGKWLIPGLTDMHVHVPSDGLMRPPKYTTEPPSMFFSTQDMMTPYIANGVTQIFNLDSRAEHIGQRNEIESGRVLGPHMALAALINGGNSPRGRIVNTPEAGRQAVRSARAEGYDFIKVYSDLNIETFQAIVEEAGKVRMKVVGHIPDAFVGQLDKAFVPNFAMVAHAEEFSKQSETFSDADAARFVQLALKNGSWLTPTMTTMKWIASESRGLDEMRAQPGFQYMHPLLQSKWVVANQYNRNATPARIAYFDKMVEFHVRLVRAFHTAGVPIVAGTDALTSGVVPGFSLHDELELLVSAGLKPEEALASATRLASVWLGTEVDRGTIEAGKRADLVLLDADPRADIRNTRKIAGVFRDGRWHDRASLDAMLADLSRRNTASKDQFDWNVVTKR
jgi:imidazolonepropionase-like amidohydrolase